MLGRMNRRRRDAVEPDAVVDEPARPGPGLARGPALLIGTILAGFGLALFLQAGNTPTDQFPDGTVTGERFLGFEVNGWTAWFTTAAGVALLIGSSQHVIAKLTSFVVAVALGWAAVVALIDGDDVYGLAAANNWTALGWAVPAVVLLLNVFAPRLAGRRRRRDAVAVDRRDTVAADRREGLTPEDDVVDRREATRPRLGETIAPATPNGTTRTGRFDRDHDDDALLADDTRTTPIPATPTPAPAAPAPATPEAAPDPAPRRGLRILRRRTGSGAGGGPGRGCRCSPRAPGRPGDQGSTHRPDPGPELQAVHRVPIAVVCAVCHSCLSSCSPRCPPSRSRHPRPSLRSAAGACPTA